MGTKISELIQGKEIEIIDLKGKTFTVDAHNILYQFLSTIRQADGSYLTDSKGNVTSHLIGLFSRITRLMMNDMKFIFCFDGKIPDLKHGELAKRREAKERAMKKYKEAKERGDQEEMLKYSVRTAKLTPAMIEEAKKLIEALGQMWIQAPSEGEAQASYMVRKRDACAVVSQDADCFLFGSPRLIKNLAITGKRKLPGKHSYVNVKPELFHLDESLGQLGIDKEQLIVLATLVGTDFNPKGIKGIGPKTALKLVKQHGKNYDKIFEEAEWNKHFDISWQSVVDAIKDMEVTDKYNISFSEPDEKTVREILVESHDFSSERVNKTLDELKKAGQQKGLEDFF